MTTSEDFHPGDSSSPGDGPRVAARQLGRFRVLDARRVNLDGFVDGEAELGLIAMESPYDPAPSLIIRDGRVVGMDGKSEADFDVIDEFIARRGLDLSVAEEAMATPDLELARMAVDMTV